METPLTPQQQKAASAFMLAIINDEINLNAPAWQQIFPPKEKQCKDIEPFPYYFNFKDQQQITNTEPTYIMFMFVKEDGPINYVKVDSNSEHLKSIVSATICNGLEQSEIKKLTNSVPGFDFKCFKPRYKNRIRGLPPVQNQHNLYVRIPRNSHEKMSLKKEIKKLEKKFTGCLTEALYK